MTGKVDESLLELDKDDVTNSEIYQKLLQQAIASGALNPDSGKQEQQPPAKNIIPKPGCCMKCKTDKGGKVFVNVCQADVIPNAPEASEEELVQILSSEDQPDFRMPMSIGEPHEELDNHDKPCTVIDVAVSPAFFQRLQTPDRPVLHSFFCTAMLEGIQEKYKLTLDKEVRVLKHKKAMGTIQEQAIRTKRFVREIGEASLAPPVVHEPTPETPKYTFVREPPTGTPEFLVGEIQLPKVSSSRQILLDVGVDRIVVDCRPFYHLDVYFNFDFNSEESGAQFNVDTKVLTVTIPINGS